MTNQIETHISNLSKNLKQANEQTTQLESVLTKTFQMLSKHGVKVSVDVDSIIQSLAQSLKTASRSGQKVVDQMKQLQELVRTSALITSSLDLDQVLQEVMDTVIQLTGAERAYLMLYEKETNDFSIRAARDWDRETIAESDITFSRSVINAAITQGEPILTTNAQDDARFQGMASVMSNSLRSIVVVPLILKDKPVGVLYADNRIEYNVFTQDSLPILTAFANQAAIAISNARLFEKVKTDLDHAKREVQQLRIVIDQNKLSEQVKEITDSDYFQNLSKAARDMRRSTKTD